MSKLSFLYTPHLRTEDSQQKGNYSGIFIIGSVNNNILYTFFHYANSHESSAETKGNAFNIHSSKI